jgi:hypothetical protein
VFRIARMARWLSEFVCRVGPRVHRLAPAMSSLQACRPETCSCNYEAGRAKNEEARRVPCLVRFRPVWSVR